MRFQVTFDNGRGQGAYGLGATLVEERDALVRLLEPLRNYKGPG